MGAIFFTSSFHTGSFSVWTSPTSTSSSSRVPRPGSLSIFRRPSKSRARPLIAFLDGAQARAALVQARPLDGDAEQVAHRMQEPQVLLGQPTPIGGGHVEQAQLFALDLRLTLPFLRYTQIYVEYGGEDRGGSFNNTPDGLQIFLPTSLSLWASTSHGLQTMGAPPSALNGCRTPFPMTKRRPYGMPMVYFTQGSLLNAESWGMQPAVTAQSTSGVLPATLPTEPLWGSMSCIGGAVTCCSLATPL